MRRFLVRHALIALAIVGLGAPSGAALKAQTADVILREIKLALFDNDWEKALASSRRLQSDYPDYGRISEAKFYEAQALASMEKNVEALAKYESVIDNSQGLNEVRLEAARLSVIDLSVKLYLSGTRSYLDRARRYLEGRNKALRYFSALKISYISDKSVCGEAVTVLKEILRSEEDEELRNRASIALLRCDPKLAQDPDLNAVSSARRGPNRSIRVVVIEEGVQVAKLSLPLSMVRAISQLIPDEARRELRREGIDPDNLVEELLRMRDILEVKTEDGSLRIWIE